MTEDSDDTALMLPIQAVERETGVSKELLRMWERRYGFPQPARDTQGDRIYPMDQVNRLRLLRRLIEQGFRPGKIISLASNELDALLKAQGQDVQQSFPELEKELLSALQSQDPGRVRAYLSHQLVSLGLQRFVVDFLAHATAVVGDSWMRGDIQVHEEHLFTEQVQGLVRNAISNLSPSTQPPRVLLTTPPDELHTLGILMVEALLRLDNVDAVSYGAQMPLRDVVQAVSRHRMHVVALSISASFPATRAVEYLEELRFRLPASVDIWAGGAALRSSRRQVDGVRLMTDLGSLGTTVLQWRRQHR